MGEETIRNPEEKYLYGNERYNARLWVNKIDDLFREIKRQGLKIGLEGQKDGIRIYVENTVCEKDSPFRKDYGDHVFAELESGENNGQERQR